jgi:hypothetical protein
MESCQVYYPDIAQFYATASWNLGLRPDESDDNAWLNIKPLRPADSSIPRIGDLRGQNKTVKKFCCFLVGTFNFFTSHAWPGVRLFPNYSKRSLVRFCVQDKPVVFVVAPNRPVIATFCGLHEEVIPPVQGMKRFLNAFSPHRQHEVEVLLSSSVLKSTMAVWKIVEIKRDVLVYHFSWFSRPSFGSFEKQPFLDK